MAHVATRATVLAACATAAWGHGMMTRPVARNGNNNGMVAGGPGTVYSGGAPDNYKHGICGDAPGVQTHNVPGPIKAEYTAGETIQVDITVTAHHGGWFEFDLCDDASQLSEQCFSKYRLIKKGCQCTCPPGTVGENNCEACFECRRYWKPQIAGMLVYYFTSGYTEQGSLVLPSGGGNIYDWTFSIQYELPRGVKSQNAVLRWHWLTANSCYGEYSQPEEFWNCADVKIKDAAGDAGPAIVADDNALKALPVENLVPIIGAGGLTGVQWACSKGDNGNLKTIGTAAEYADCCGLSVGPEEWERCKKGRSNPPIGPDEGGSSGGDEVQCDNTQWPIGVERCPEECGSAFVMCINGKQSEQFCPAARPVCKGNKCVAQSECDAPTVPPANPTKAPTPSPTPQAICPALPNNNGCTDGYCASCSAKSQGWPCNVVPKCCSCMGDPMPMPTTTTGAPPDAVCGTCTGCLWSTGVCYTDVTDPAYCKAWPTNTWCGTGSSRLYQESPGLQKMLDGLQEKYGEPRQFASSGEAFAALQPQSGAGKPKITPEQQLKLNPITNPNTGWLFMAEWSNDVHSLQPAGAVGSFLWSLEPPGIQVAGMPVHFTTALNAINAMDPGFRRFGTEVQAVRVGNGWVGLLDMDSPCTKTCAAYDGKYCFAAIFTPVNVGTTGSNPDADVTCAARQKMVADKCSACAQCNPCDVVAPQLQEGLSKMKPGANTLPAARLDEIPQEGGEPVASVASESAGAVTVANSGRFGFFSLAVAGVVGAFAGALGQRAVTSTMRAAGARINVAPHAEEMEAATSDTVDA